MKIGIGAAIGAIAAFLVGRAMAARAKRRGTAGPEEMYWGLRGIALQTKPEDIGLSPIGDREPYAVIMDMDVSGQTATITSFASGDASLYVSTGGGTIGSGRASQDVAAAAKEFVKAAATHLEVMTKSDKQPVPQSGQVIFYVVTREGIYSVSRSKQALGDGKDALSPLFFAGQEVLTQIRLLQEQQDQERAERNRSG